MTTRSTSATVTGNTERVVNRRDVTPGRSRPVNVINSVRFLAFMLLTTLLRAHNVSLGGPSSRHPAFAWKPPPTGDVSVASAEQEVHVAELVPAVLPCQRLLVHPA